MIQLDHNTYLGADQFQYIILKQATPKSKPVAKTYHKTLSQVSNRLIRDHSHQAIKHCASLQEIDLKIEQYVESLTTTLEENINDIHKS